jgi:hypothetical protein
MALGLMEQAPLVSWLWSPRHLAPVDATLSEKRAHILVKAKADHDDGRMGLHSRFRQ